MAGTSSLWKFETPNSKLLKEICPLSLVLCPWSFVPRPFASRPRDSHCRAAILQLDHENISFVSCRTLLFYSLTADDQTSPRQSASSPPPPTVASFLVFPQSDSLLSINSVASFFKKALSFQPSAIRSSQAVEGSRSKSYEQSLGS